MSSHNEPEHICSPDCEDNPDETTDFTLTIIIPDGNILLISEWYQLFNGVLFGLLGDNVISGEEITIPINNARTLAKIIFKLNQRFSQDYSIEEFIFNSLRNNLTVVIGEG